MKAIFTCTASCLKEVNDEMAKIALQGARLNEGLLTMPEE